MGHPANHRIWGTGTHRSRGGRPTVGVLRCLTLGRIGAVLTAFLIPLAVFLAGVHSVAVPHHICPETGAVLHGSVHVHEDHSPDRDGSTDPVDHEHDHGQSGDACTILAFLGSPAPTVEAPTVAIGAVLPLTEIGKPLPCTAPPWAVPPHRYAPKQSPPAQTA